MEVRRGREARIGRAPRPLFLWPACGQEDRIIALDAALNHGAVEVGDQRADVASRARADALGGLAGAERAHHVAGGLVPAGLVGLVDRVASLAFGDLHVGVRQEERAHRPIQGKAVHRATSGVDEHRRRAVEDVAGGNLFMALAQEVAQTNLFRRAAALVDAGRA